MKHVNVFVAHPFKHHVFPMVAGIGRGRRDVALALPFYDKGLVSLVKHIPGKIGRKAAGYHYESLHRENIEVISKLKWQINRLRSNGDVQLKEFVAHFDKSIAFEIEQGKISSNIFVTLQDYMPFSVRAAKKKSMMIWTDQILNNGPEVRERIRRHYAEQNLGVYDAPEEDYNTEILQHADVVTTPSSYTLSGIADRISVNAIKSRIPYGVDTEKFIPQPRTYRRSIVVAARANNVRKGGHLLVQALSKHSIEISRAAKGREIIFQFIGGISADVRRLLLNTNLPETFRIEEKIVANSEMPLILANADIFIMPSLSEGMSLVAVEAMSCGLPLIITPYCGIDCFNSEDMGLQVSDSVPSVADGLVHALENIGEWARWGEAARAAATEITWKEYEKKIFQLTEQIQC